MLTTCTKLHKYKAGERLGPMSAVMFQTAQGLSDDDIQAVTAYIATSSKRPQRISPHFRRQSPFPSLLC